MFSDSHKNYENIYQNKLLENFSENKQGGGTLNFVKEKFGSQYLYYDDEEDGASNINITDPGTLMMS
ncbi:hypothetical protein K0M31_002007 [Melipona bicolor]|uniref:Uncharacterized protein n=1 Tax=Melipona bicolor TaxID=60889 RepID=A0AA40GGM4_9HYME|nr:hypothetical protein K0M31_002007 [Melipona bicolor]